MRDSFIFEFEPMSNGLRPNGSVQEIAFEGGGRVSAPLCGPYEPNEVQRSNTDAGHLPSDFFAGPSGYYLIADFAVASSNIKNSVRNNANLKSWLNHQLQTAAKDPSLKLKILGYTDCVNRENRNTTLRAARARNVRRLIETMASRDPRWRFLKSRITDGPARPDQYLRDNSNATNRATNRGVSLEITRTISVEPLAVTCKADLIHRAIKLLQAPRSIQLMGDARAGRLLNIFKRINDKATDDRYMTEDDVSRVARSGLKYAKWRKVSKYLDDVCAAAKLKNIPITDDHILHETWRLDNGIMNGICRLVDFRTGFLKPKVPASFNALYATIFGLMRNPKSVYVGYRNAERECPTRSRTVPVKKKPTKKDDPAVTIPDPGIKWPKPQNQTTPTQPGGGGSNWLWNGLKGVATMGATFISGAMAMIPTPVLEKAVFGAWAIFQLRNLTPTMALGLAGEKAAQVLAEWALGKAGINPDLVFDLNRIRKNFPGFDFIHPSNLLSVKAYGVVGKLAGEALEKQVILKYRDQLAKLVGNSFLDRRYQMKIAKVLLQNRSTIGRSWPTGLAGNVSEETVAKYIRNFAQIMIPDDHVPLLKKYEGTRLYNEYKKGGLPGIPADLPLKDATDRINDLVIERIRPLGLRTTDLKLILDVADRLPSAQNSVISGGKRNWPSNWGTPPTWSSRVMRTP